MKAPNFKGYAYAPACAEPILILPPFLLIGTFFPFFLPIYPFSKYNQQSSFPSIRTGHIPLGEHGDSATHANAKALDRRCVRPRVVRHVGIAVRIGSTAPYTID